MGENWLWEYLKSLVRDKLVEVMVVTIVTAIWAWSTELPGPVLLCVVIGVAAFTASLINAIQGWWLPTKREQHEVTNEPPAQSPNRTFKDFLTPGMILIGLVLVFILAHTFLKEDQKTNRELQSELTGTEEYIHILSGKLSLLLPYSTPEQRESLTKSLKQMGHNTVSITYLDSADSRPGGYAGHLQKIFQEADWAAKLNPKTWTRRTYQGLSIKIDDLNNIKPTQQKVIQAFQQAGIPYGYIPNQEVEDRIELVIGIL